MRTQRLRPPVLLARFEKPDDVVGVFGFVTQTQRVRLRDQECNRTGDLEDNVESAFVVGKFDVAGDGLGVGGQQFSGSQRQGGESPSEIVFGGGTFGRVGSEQPAGFALWW